MSLRFALLGLGLSTLALGACTPAETPRDVAYYSDHPDDRAAQMVRCRNDPGGIGKGQNCLNALRADADAASKKAWGQPTPASRVANPDKL